MFRSKSKLIINFSKTSIAPIHTRHNNLSKSYLLSKPWHELMATIYIFKARIPVNSAIRRDGLIG